MAVFLAVSLILVTISINYCRSQLVVDFTLPSTENYLELYSTSLVHYRNADYQRTQLYTELALADKRLLSRLKSLKSFMLLQRQP